MNRLLPLLLLFLSLMMPFFAFAGPVLVPEGCQEGCPCTLCDLYTLAKNFVDFLLYLTIPIATIMFVWGGISMIMAQGGDGVTKGRKAIAAAVIGMGLAFFAWIILNAIITTLAFGPVVGGNPTNWIETLKCDLGGENRCNLTFPVVPDGVIGPGGGIEVEPGDAGPYAARLERYEAKINELAAKYGVPPELIKAFIATESGANPNAVSQKGAVGLMQLLPSTARGLDPSLAGLSDSQIAQKLKDPNYNMELGTKLVGQLYTKYGGDRSLMAAEYNGGPGANLQSSDCPGQRRWQCEWDDPAHTIPNTGYRETRKYVHNIISLEEGFHNLEQ